jgi:hypothetical protein
MTDRINLEKPDEASKRSRERREAFFDGAFLGVMLEATCDVAGSLLEGVGGVLGAIFEGLGSN